MSELKILHAADLHLDSPFEGLGAAKAAQRRDEQRRLLHRIAQLAEEESVDIVLLAGDLLDSDSTYAETAEALVGAREHIRARVHISRQSRFLLAALAVCARKVPRKRTYI